MHLNRNRLNPYTLYLVLTAVTAFGSSTIGSINMVYQVEVVKLNPLQLVLVGTMLEGVYFLFQVPTGVIADVYSRRFAVIFGIALSGVAFMLEGAIPRFEAALAAMAIWAIGAAFSSGAEEAWIASEIGEERAGHVFLRSTQVYQVTSLIGVPFGIGLATVSLQLPMLIGAAILLLTAVFLLFLMPEQHFHPERHEQRSTWHTLSKQMMDSGRAIKRSPLLITILFITFFGGMASEGFDRLQTAHFIHDFAFPALGPLPPVTWFGVMSVVSTLLVLAVAEIVRRRIDTNRHRVLVGTMFVFNVVLILSVVVFGLAGNFFLALAAFWIAGVARSCNQPLYNTWLTRNTDQRVRATVISVAGQTDAIGQIAGGPGIGLIGTLVSLRAAIVTTGLLLAPNVLFFARALGQGKPEPVAVKGEDENGEALQVAESVGDKSIHP